MRREGPQQTLILILVPMLLTFSVQRLILHHSNPDSHVFIAGYLVHHLFTGALLQIPAAFFLAFGIRSQRSRIVSKVLLGVGSAMVLDEVVFLICTDGSGQAYRGGVSFWGAVILIALASGVLCGAYWITSRAEDAGRAALEASSKEPGTLVGKWRCSESGRRSLGGSDGNLKDVLLQDWTHPADRIADLMPRNWVIVRR